MPQVSRGKAVAGDLSYNRGKIPRAARDVYEWRIRARGLQVSRCLRYEHDKMKERSFGAKTPLRMTWSGMLAAFASKDDGLN